MWICPDCGEKLEDQFDSCWKCADKIAAPATTNITTALRRKGCLAAIIGVIVFVEPMEPGVDMLTTRRTSQPAARPATPVSLEALDRLKKDSIENKLQFF